MKSYVTITLNTRAAARLKKNKLPGDSYSDVVLREMPDPCETAGEVYERLHSIEAPRANPKLRAKLLAGRGRRSNRALVKR